MDFMRSARTVIGGLGNLMFKQAYLWAQMREGHIPDIYVQGEKYWAKYKEEIRTMYGQGIVPRKYGVVALHIRRGDYLKAPEFHLNLFETDYYKRAVAMFPPETKFLVFCKDNQNRMQDWEDQAWCVEFMTALGVDFAMYGHYDEHDDLNSMASCSGLIMANSTFSWWAAYLGWHDTVICPKQWFTDGKERIELLPEWTKI